MLEVRTLSCLEHLNNQESYKLSKMLMKVLDHTHDIVNIVNESMRMHFKLHNIQFLLISSETHIRYPEGHDNRIIH